MMMCTRCKKRPAVVFITAMNGQERKNEGLCIVCAKKMGISQVDEYMKSMGITEEDLEALSDQFMEINDGNDFEVGGNSTMPDFFSNMFGQFGAGRKINKAQESTAADSVSEGTEDTKEKKKGLLGKDKDKKDKKKKLKFLTNYATNLTDRAKDGKLDNIIGRDKEIDRVIQILSRRQKNNPCLIGEPGVGKTAIAEGIAQKIASGDVPFHIKNKELYLLDLTAMVAGTQFRGQFESRVKGLVEEVISLGNVILFIDEVHNLVGAGDSAEGSMNAANILKPALSRGEVQVIGATTFKEYRKYIEKDAALERRFQPVTVTEPTLADTIKVLEGIRKYYEDYHKVKIDDATLRMCAILSERYINDRYLPDKAIDLLDEACARAGIRSPELERFESLTDELKSHQDSVDGYESMENPDYEAIAKEKAEILKIENELEEVSKKAAQVKVTEEDISSVIELWTGIPAQKVIETEYSKIRNLKDTLSARIIGQDKAVDAVAKAVKRTRAGLSKRRRPASFIFVGPTGVGKTELVKVLGEELFDATEPLIRVDMSEYMERHSVAKLIGSPPGYVGYDEAGQLTEKVRRRPYSVILFDEIEKAHPDVMNVLLQILDEGKITDAQGRSVSFENTVIVMTSNAGSTSQETGVGFNKTDNEISKEKAMKGLRDFLRPEFLGRVDEVVVFNPLTEENYADICALMLNEMKEPLEEKGIELEYDRASCEYIAKKAHNKKLGARDIRRVIRQEVEDKIASILIDEMKIETKKLSLTVKNNELNVEASA